MSTNPREVISEIISASRGIAEEAVAISTGFENFAIKLVALSDLLEEILNAKPEKEETKKDLVEVEDNGHKVHKDLQMLLTKGQVFNPEISTKNLTPLKYYSIIMAGDTANGEVQYFKLSDKTGRSYYQPQSRNVEGLVFEKGAYYIIHAIPSNKKGIDKWDWQHELTKAEATSKAKQLSRPFAIAKSDGIRY